MSEETGREKYRVGLFFPLLIIFVGIVLLLSNLHIIPDAWSLLLRFWPIVFLLSGVEDLFNRKWTSTVFNYGIGSILLLANFGFFAMSTWQIILNFWPVVIIAIGMEILLRDRSVTSILFGVGVSLLVIVGMFWFAWQSPIIKDGTPTPISIDQVEVDEVKLTLNPLAANFQLKTEKDQKQFLSGEIVTAHNEQLKVLSELTGSEQTIELSSEGIVYLPSRNIKNGYPWNLTLNSDFPVALDIEQNVGKQKLFLDDLVLNKLNSRLMIGTMEIFLPEKLENAGKLECIIGEMTIIVPKDMPLQIQLDSGMTGVSLAEGFTRIGDTIYSPEASRTSSDSLLLVKLPMGSLKVKNP